MTIKKNLQKEAVGGRCALRLQRPPIELPAGSHLDLALWAAKESDRATAIRLESPVANDPEDTFGRSLSDRIREQLDCVGSLRLERHNYHCPLIDGAVEEGSGVEGIVGVELRQDFGQPCTSGRNGLLPGCRQLQNVGVVKAEMARKHYVHFSLQFDATVQ